MSILIASILNLVGDIFMFNNSIFFTAFLFLISSIGYSKSVSSQDLALTSYKRLVEKSDSLISQVDDRFLAAGMIQGKDVLFSKLCGPVSATIGLSAFRAYKNQFVTSDQLFNELLELNSIAITKLERSIIGGIYSNGELNEVIDLYVQHYLPNAKVEFFSKDLLFDFEIYEDDINRMSTQESHLDFTFSILKVMIEDANSKDLGNHFITVLSYNSLTKEIAIADPFEPKKIITGKLKPALSFGSPTFELNLDSNLDAFGSSNMVIEGLSVIKISDL